VVTTTSRERKRRLRDLRRRGLVAKIVDVDLSAVAEKFDVSNEQLADGRRGVGT
jgi:hypothetical protein